MSKKSVFISYRWSDGTDFSSHLYSHLNETGKDIDVYLDANVPSNQDTLEEVLKENIVKRDNVVFLFTEAALKRLLQYDPYSGEKDWVYFEMKTAFDEGKSILPVYLETLENNIAINRLFTKLFRKFGQDTLHVIFRTPGMRDWELCREIEFALSYPRKYSRTDMSDIFWVGTRLSDISGLESNFAGCVVLFGDWHDPEHNHYVMCPKDSSLRVDHNDASDLSQDVFIESSMREIAQKHSNAKFMFYNPSTIYRLNFDERFIQERVLCLNDQELLENISNKALFRREMLSSGVIPMLPVQSRTRVNCEYEELLQELKEGRFDEPPEITRMYGIDVPPIAYDEHPRFIVQAPVSSGGSGTFILNESNAKYILSSLDPRAKYLVSVYHTKNIPVNIHALISNDETVLLPASVQLEREVESENKLLYKGADFSAYQQIDYRFRGMFEKQANAVAEQLRQKGYRGVLGIDAIIHNGRVNILEVNARFQASTELINRAFLRRKRKSVQEMNLECFTETGLSQEDAAECRSLFVRFSNYSFSNEGQFYHYRHAYETALKRPDDIIVQEDGYTSDRPESSYVAQSYLFRVVFPWNIASISEDNTVWINENITPPDPWLFRKIRRKEMLALKLALMIQGINVEGRIRAKLREATNNAVDLQFGTIQKPIIINSPTRIRFVEFSPFSLKCSEHVADAYTVYYYGEPVMDDVGIFPTDQNQSKTCNLPGKRKYAEVAYLSTDRLRVHLTNACQFKLQDKGCCFCNIPVEENREPIRQEELQEVLATYMKDRETCLKNRNAVALRHFLIGGQSLDHCDERLIETARILHETHLPIYVMSLPLRDETIYRLTELGVLEFAYNIEIFDERCREKYMPGKGVYKPADETGTSKDYYMKRLKRTRQILNGANYNASLKVVRSMVIVGLEPWESMEKGIQELIDINIEPMLSVFRPLPDTDLEYLNAPPIRMVYDLFLSVSEKLYNSSDVNDEEMIEWNEAGSELEGTICDFRKLGPECPCCQNNTVSLPWPLQRAVVRREPLGATVERTVFANYPYTQKGVMQHGRENKRTE